MFVSNWIFWPTLAAAVLCFILGSRLAAGSQSLGRRLVLFGVGVGASVPGFLFAIYYTHVLDRAAWFYELRSWTLSETWAAGLGLFGGICVGLLRREVAAKLSLALRSVLTVVVVGVLLMVLVTPYAKPLIVPLQTPLHNEWRDGVCIQSSPSTCGPSSAATLLKQFGISATEEELAREAYTCGSGTENWFLVRAIRRRGLNAWYEIDDSEPDSLPYPSIAGTDLFGKGGSGHFIAILSRTGDQYVVGDPMAGRLVMTRRQLSRRFYFTGFFLRVSRP